MHPATFASREAARAIVQSLDSGIYYLAHGEYARPLYTVRKVRNGDCFYIHARRYFYAGTLHARPSGALEWESSELYNH